MSRRSVQSAAETAASKRATEMKTAQVSNPNADFVEQNVKTNFAPTSTQAQQDLQNAALKAASNPQLTTQQRTELTRQEAGAPLRNAASGAMGQSGAEGFNPDSMGYSAEGLNTVGQQDSRNPSGYVPEGAKVGNERDMNGPVQGTGTNGQPYESPAQFAQRKAALAQEELAQKQKQIAEQEAARSTQAGKVAAKTGGGQVENDPDTAFVDAALAGLPPEQAALIGNSLKGYIQANKAEQDALTGIRDSEKSAADASQARYDKLFDKMEADSKLMSEKIDTFLKGTQEKQEKNLTEQKETALERLQWDEERIVREQKKKNDRAVTKLAASIALTGGIGSSNANKNLIEVELEGEQYLSDLQKEFSFKRTDVMQTYTQSLNEIYDRYGMLQLQEMKDHKAEISRINQARFGQEEATDARKAKADADYTTRLAALQTDKAKEIKSSASDVFKALQDERALKISEERQSKQDAFQLFNFAFTQSTDPALRSAAVSKMVKAGYEMPEGIDFNADPISFQLAAMNNAAKATSNSTSDPFRFTGEGASEKQALAASALSVVGQLEGGVELNKSQLNYVNQLLDRGEVEKARTHLRGLAVAALKGTQENAYAARGTIVAASDALKKDLTEIQNSSKGQTLFNGLKQAGALIAGKGVDELTADDFTAYQKKVSDLRKKLGTESDPRLQRIFAQVENIAGIIINERYGAAVSDGEQQRAKEYIAMSGNTLSEMIIKLDEFSKFSKMQNEMMLNTKMGMATDNLDLSAPDVNSTPSVPSDDDFNNMFKAHAEPVTTNIGTRKVKGNPDAVSALERADRDFFADTGEHLFVNSSFRDTAQQTAAYERYLRGEISAAAKPGTSLHEKGLAFDITNYEKARPYLERYGFKQFDTKKDPGHFSYGIVG